MHTIRQALEKDEDSVFRLASQLSPKFAVEREVFSASFSRLITKEDVFLYVAEASEAVIAYLLGWSGLAFYSNGPVGWVQEIVVHPEHRRSGVGRLLMDGFERWSANHGARLVSLATRGASDFYLALGYQESATYYKKIIQPNASLEK
jgi:ribosomal protein S18 acetylase RimI-like enzyme